MICKIKKIFFIKVIIIAYTQQNLLLTPKFQEPQITADHTFLTFPPGQHRHWIFYSNATYVGFNYPAPKAQGQQQFLYVNRNGFSAAQFYIINPVRNIYVRLEVDYKMPILQTNGTVEIVVGVSNGTLELNYRRMPGDLMLFATIIGGIQRHNPFIQIRSHGFAQNSTQENRNGFRLYQFKIFQLNKHQVQRHKKNKISQNNANSFAKKQLKRKVEDAVQGLVMLGEGQRLNKQMKINQ